MRPLHRDRSPIKVTTRNTNNMKKTFTIQFPTIRQIISVIIAVFVVLFGLWAVDAVAAPYPTGVGGTGTSASPSAGMVLIGNGNGTYTPAYLSCSSGCSVANASGSVAITVPTASGTSVFAGPYILVTASGTNGYVVQNIGVLSLASSSDIGVSNATGTGITFSFLNPKGYATTTIQSVLNSLSAIGLASYNSSTGQFSVSSSSLHLGTASQYSFSDFLPSSTVYVANTNGNWVGTWQNKNVLANFHIRAQGRRHQRQFTLMRGDLSSFHKDLFIERDTD